MFSGIVRRQGPPQVSFQIPEVPVSSFELTMPGDKEVTVTPSVSVTRTSSGDNTVTRVNIPMTSSVTFTWTEAIPEEMEARLSANASIYHAAHAEEGVLHVRAMIVYEITRGETSVIQFQVPSNDYALFHDHNRESEQGTDVYLFLEEPGQGQGLFDVVEYHSMAIGVSRENGDRVRVFVARAPRLNDSDTPQDAREYKLAATFWMR